MRSSTVRNVFRNTSGSIQQLIGTITLSQPRALHIRVLILLPFLSFAHDRATKSLFRHVQTTQLTTIGNHVAVEFQVVALRITPHQPCLTIVINHHCRIDMIP